LALQDKFLEKFSNGLIEGFYKAVSGWIVCRRRHTLDSEFVTESLEGLADKLRPIIMNNPLWHAKVVDHMMFNKLDHVRYLYLPQGDSFNLFGKVIGYG